MLVLGKWIKIELEKQVGKLTCYVVRSSSDCREANGKTVSLLIQYILLSFYLDLQAPLLSPMYNL